MICTSCHFENLPGMKFCGQCGTSLMANCPSCGFGNPKDYRFCGNCGEQLAEQPLIHQEKNLSEAPEKKNVQAERRHLTVMFCDLVGSTALSNQMDPEELREIVREYQEVCSKVINRFEGHIAQYLGDGILVYFGYPLAHENDAHRAVSSGLGIIEAIERFGKSLQESKNIDIAVRIGVHTGHVVIGDIGGEGKTEQLALGATPNIAARLEGLAETNSLVISADTYRLVSKFFECEEGGKHELKGITEPMQLYKVHHENIARSRLDLDSSTVERLPLIGRQTEVDSVMGLWEDAKQGKSHILLLSGEAGVGKSHLLQTIKTKVAEDTAWLNVHYCSPYHKSTAFHPIIDTLENIVLDFKPEESSLEKISKIEGLLVQNGIDLEEMVPLFAQLLSVSIEGSKYKPSSFSLAQQKQKLIYACVHVYLERAKEQALLLVFEDLHYADNSTLELLSLLVSQEPKFKILTVLSFRPEFTPPWGMQAHIAPITLSNLNHEHSKSIIYELTGGKSLPEEVVEEIIQKTDGVPLFIEELTKMVLESGMVREQGGGYELTSTSTAMAIPSTLHDSLVARLDRMSAVKELAQLGATIGREFSYEMIKAVSLMEEHNIREGLSKLVKAKLLHQSGIPPEASYQFRHALVKDAALQSLVKTQRQSFHQRIAQAMANQFVDMVERDPAALAYHYEHAGLAENAVVHWTKAGKRASDHSAFEEALSYLERGAKLIESVSDNEIASQLELYLLAVQSPIFTMTDGFASQRGAVANNKMKALAESQGDYSRLFLSLRGLTLYHLFGGEPKNALEYAQLGLELADSQLETETLVEANRLIGHVCIYTGEFEKSLRSFDKAISLYDPKKHVSILRLTGADPGNFSLGQSSHVIWYLGYPDQALNRARQAETEANKLQHPYSQSISMLFSCWVFVLLGDAENAHKKAEECIELCEKFGLFMFSSDVKVFLGWAKARLGEFDDGLELVRNSIKWREEMKINSGTNLHFAILIEILLSENRIDEGLKIVSHALEKSEKSTDTLYLPEIHRLNGELLLAQDDRKNSKFSRDHFAKALELAGTQKARSFELKAAMSLSGLLARTGEYDEAYLIISKTYNWFTEGFESRDLKEARTLLDELFKNIKTTAI